MDSLRSLTGLVVSGVGLEVGDCWSMVKEISSFSTQTSFYLCHVRKDGTPATVEAELKKMHDEAQSYAIQQDGEFRYGLEDIPDLGLWAQMPKVEGIDTRQFQGWNRRQQEL